MWVGANILDMDAFLLRSKQHGYPQNCMNVIPRIVIPIYILYFRYITLKNPLRARELF